MRFAVISILVLMWLATLAIAVAWVFGIDLGIDPEPATVLLGTVSTGLTAVVAYFGVKLETARKALEEERFSTPMALAAGYVANFIEPALTHLLKQTQANEAPPRLHIYIPKRLEELNPASRERILARIRAAHCQEEAMQLDFQEGRARDIIAITRSGNADRVYFDFPTTLLTLTALVDYKVDSAENRSAAQEKEALGHEYITHFKDFLLDRLAQLGLSEYVVLTDQKLAFLQEPEKPNP